MLKYKPENNKKAIVVVCSVWFLIENLIKNYKLNKRLESKKYCIIEIPSELLDQIEESAVSYFNCTKSEFEFAYKGNLGKKMLFD